MATAGWRAGGRVCDGGRDVPVPTAVPLVAAGVNARYGGGRHRHHPHRAGTSATYGRATAAGRPRPTAPPALPLFTRGCAANVQPALPHPS